MANKPQPNFIFSDGYGDNYRLLREEKKLSQKELALKLNMVHSTISDIEHSKKPPTIEQLQAYHDYFGASYEYLLGEHKSPQQDVEALINEVGLSPTAWSMIYGIKSDGWLKALDLVLSNKNFIKIINQYSVMIELWQNSTDCIHDENDLKRHSDLLKFIEQHRDELEEMGAYAQLINNKEDVQRKLKCIRHDIEKLQRKLQDEIVYSITGLKDI